MMVHEGETEVAVDRDFLRYNGTFTVLSPSGEHRTFRVSNGADDMPRIVSVLTGPENTSAYTGFGFVTRSGKNGPFCINLWRKKSTATGRRWFAPKAYERLPDDSQWGVLAATLLDLALGDGSRLRAAGFTVMAQIACRRCGRALTTPESIESGIGPICIEKEF